MRKWQGIRDDVTEIGTDTLVLATGVSFRVEGELRRRPGMAWLSSIGGTTLSTFRSPVTGVWVNAVTAAGAIQSLKLSTGVTATLTSGYSTSSLPTPAAIGPRHYWTNDFDRMQVWDGVWSATRDAGIAAPASALGAGTTGTGTITTGVHDIRYRYVDSKSPGGSYRSNPSDALEQTFTASQKITFSIGSSGTDIIQSTDPKVDTIQIEMTLVDGSDYYVVTTVANTATTVDVDISDSLLALNNLTADFDDFGHEQPPAAAYVFECRGYAFLCGSHERTFTVGVTSAATGVTGTGFSALWTDRLIRFGTDAKVYEISSITATTITLTENYIGTTGSVSATIFSREPNRVYWSKQYGPEEYKALTRARDVLYGTGDKVVGGVDFQGDAWFMGMRSMCRLVFTDDPANGEVNPVPGFHGLWNARCLVPINGILLGWGPNGAWEITGGAPRWISSAIDITVATLIDTTTMRQAFGEYDPIEKVVTWHFVATGDTTPRSGLRYDIASEHWSLIGYRQGIDAAVTVPDDNGKLRLAVSDATNARLYYHTGATDGVPASSTGAYTVTAGGTTTSVPVIDALPTGTGTDLSALVLYRVSTAETAVITSNTTTTITLATALATSVTNGESVYVGAIPCSFKTAWWLAENLAEKSRPHLLLYFNPSSTGAVQVKVYKNFETSPVTFTANSDDTWADGVTVVNNQTYVTVNLSGSATITDGFVSIPMPADWARAWRAEVICLSPAGTFRLLDARFEVTAKREVGEEVTE